MPLGEERNKIGSICGKVRENSLANISSLATQPTKPRI